MPRINDWNRVIHYRNLEEAIGSQSSRSQVTIAKWTHENAGRIEHIYEPVREKPLVKFHGDRKIPEEGRYSHRSESGPANKQIMRNYP